MKKQLEIELKVKAGAESILNTYNGQKKDNYKRAHRFYSLHNNIRYVHTYYKNKERRRKKKNPNACNKFVCSKTKKKIKHIYTNTKKAKKLII